MGTKFVKKCPEPQMQELAKREADALRALAFFGVCLSTIATMICVVSVPLAYQHFQQIGTRMQGEIDFCKARSGNIWREVSEYIKKFLFINGLIFGLTKIIAAKVQGFLRN